MIVRVVKMVFHPDSVPEFLALFEERKERIRGFAGCCYLELWRETDKDHVFFTYSHWKDEAALADYRASELFKDTWSRTKVFFSERAAAWSVVKEMIIG